jgi:hypothetical protein
MFLTLLQREGDLWNVYLSVAPDAPHAGPAQLEFERSERGGATMSLVRELPAELMEALQGGHPLSRESLDRELEAAVRAREDSSDE